jgi:response regulator RpfG family c-di-GMP phosphodiesterase
VAQAREELRRCAGTQFDPDVVHAFLTTLERPSARTQRATASAM